MRKNLKRFLFITLLLLLAACGRGRDREYYEPPENDAPPTAEPIAGPTPQPFSPDPAVWRLVWSDEFDGDTLNLSVWEIQTGTGAIYGLTGWGNYEAQYYHADNVTVQDGYLRLEARREVRSSPGEGTRSFSSGRIRSTGTEGLSVLYGRIEARIKLPVGYGLWPAFWMMPQHAVYGGWPLSGEIDIMEAMGRRPFGSTGAIHFGTTWPSNTYNHSSFPFPTGQSIAEFHVYAVEWEPDRIRWFVNDRMVWAQYAPTWWTHNPQNPAPFMSPAPFDQPFHIILNLAVGGHFDPVGTAGLNPATFPHAMYVDYVRVYELVGRDLRPLPTPPPISYLWNIPTRPGESQAWGGNYVWNGTFDQGPNGLAFWGRSNCTTTMGVTTRPAGQQGINLPPHNRRFYARDISEDTAPWDVAIGQAAMHVTNGTYHLTFYARADAPRGLTLAMQPSRVGMEDRADMLTAVGHVNSAVGYMHAHFFDLADGVSFMEVTPHAVFALTPAWVRHEATFTFTGITEGYPVDMYLAFWLGGYAAGVELDDVVLVRVE